MKTFLLKLSIVLFIVSLLTSCSSEDDSVYLNKIEEIKTTYTSLELEILDLVNNHRVAIGLNSLQKLNLISSVAKTHSSYMVNIGKVNHDYFSERNEKLIQNANAKSVGENVAFGYNTASSVVNAWIASDSHREIIENSNYTHFGISTENDLNGGNYFTHIFIKQ